LALFTSADLGLHRREDVCPVIAMLAGLATWLAVLLDGPKYFHSMFHAVSNTLILFAGSYFFKFAKPALQPLRERI
jgi:hypothetical protein